MREFLFPIITFVILMAIVIAVNAIIEKKKAALIEQLSLNNTFIMLFMLCASISFLTSTSSRAKSIGASFFIAAFITALLIEGITRKESANVNADYKVETLDLSKPLQSCTYNPADCKTGNFSFPEKKFRDSIKIDYINHGDLNIKFPFLLPTEVLQDTITTLKIKNALRMALVELFSKRSKYKYKYPVIFVSNQIPLNCPEGEFYDTVSSQYRGQFAADVLALFYDNAHVFSCNTVGESYATSISVLSDKAFYEHYGKRTEEIQKSRHKVKVKLKTKGEYK